MFVQNPIHVCLYGQGKVRRTLVGQSTNGELCDRWLRGLAAGAGADKGRGVGGARRSLRSAVRRQHPTLAVCVWLQKQLKGTAWLSAVSSQSGAMDRHAIYKRWHAPIARPPPSKVRILTESQPIADRRIHEKGSFGWPDLGRALRGRRAGKPPA